MSYLNTVLIALIAISVVVSFRFVVSEMADTSVEILETKVEEDAVLTSTTAEVAYVIDGDTLELASGERVRLLGIDTPEREECFYSEAREYVVAAVTDATVRLESDVTDRDKYGRLLRQVFVVDETGAETHLNYELVARGYAEVLPIPPDRDYRAEFKAAETAALAARLGRWGVCE